MERSTSRCQKEATKQGQKGRCSRHRITTSPRQRLGITELGQQWATTDLCAPCTGRRSPRGARSWTPRPTCRCTSAPRRPHLAPGDSCTGDISTYVHVCILTQQSATHVPHAFAPEHGSADALGLAWKRHLLKATHVVESISNVRLMPSRMQSRTNTSGQDMSHAAQEKSTLGI